MALKQASQLKSKEYYASLLSNPYVQAALNTISKAEGTAKGTRNVQDPYSTIVGYTSLSDFNDHPRQYVRSQNSTAAGKYQVLDHVWDEVSQAVGIPDFSPTSQDIFAVARIDQRGGLEPLLKGDFATFSDRVKKEWASFPGANYKGQGMRSAAQVEQWFNEYAAAAKNTPAMMNGFRQDPFAVKTIDGVRSLAKGIDQARIPTPLSREFANFNAQRSVPVPESAKAAQLARQYGNYQRGTVPHSAPSFPSGAMLTGPAAIREREERGLYAAARGAPLSLDNRSLQVDAGIIDRAGSPTMAIPDGARKSDRVTVSKSEALAKQIAEYARNPTPQGLGALREAMNGSAYTTTDKATALTEASIQINNQDSFAGAISGITKGKSVEDRARQYTAQMAGINEVARLNQDIAKGFFDPGQQIFDKNVVTRPEFAAMGASMFPDAFAGLYGPDRRASGWGLMAPTERKLPELSKVNPSAIQRMQDNLTSKMAFAQPNPSNMNISGYGFSTPAKPSGPQATGSATGSINRASAVGNLAVPGRSPGVLGGRGNINPPNVVSPPANNLPAFDENGRWTGGANLPQRGPNVSTWGAMANAPVVQAPSQQAALGPTNDPSVRAAQADLAKSNRRDQFARDLIKSMPAPAQTDAARLASQYGQYQRGTVPSAQVNPTVYDMVDVPQSSTIADQYASYGAGKIAPQVASSATQAVPVTRSLPNVPQTVGPRSPNVAAPSIAPNAADEAAKQRFDAAKPGVFQGIPPQDIYDENAPGRSGFRGFGAGGFLGNLLTGNIGNMAGIEGGNRLPGLLGVLQNVVQGLGGPQQAAQAVQTVTPALGQVMGLPAAQQAAQAGNNMVIGRDAAGRIGWMADGGLSAGALGAGWASNSPERNFGGYGGGYDPSPS